MALPTKKGRAKRRITVKQMAARRRNMAVARAARLKGKKRYKGKKIMKLGPFYNG